MKKLSIVIALCIATMGSFSFAAADTIAGQLINDDFTSTGQGALQQTLGTGLDGELKSIYILASGSYTNNPVNFKLTLKECDDISMSTSCNYIVATNGGGSFVSNTLTTYDQNYSFVKTTFDHYKICTVSASGTYSSCGSEQTGPTYSMNSVKYYSIYVNSLTLGFAMDLAGSATDNYSNGTTTATGLTSGDIYFVLLQPSGINSYIQTMNYPANNTVTPTGDVELSFDYYYAPSQGTYDKAGVAIYDLTTQTRVNGFSVSTESGGNVVTGIVSLTEGHAYSWYAYLYNSTTVLQAPITGPTYRFSTVEDLNTILLQPGDNSIDFNLPAPLITDGIASTSAATTTSRFASFLGALSHKIPWGYMWDIQDIYRNAATTSSAYGSLYFDFGALDISSSTKNFVPPRMEVFGTSTVTYYLNGSILAAFNTLASAAIMIATMYAIFKRLSGLGATAV